MWRGLTAGDGLGLPLDVLGDGRTLRVVWFTAWQAGASTALTLVAGLPLAWATARVEYRGRALARALVVVPFVLPTIVVATAFVALLPERHERGVLPILAAHVFFNVAVVVRLVGGYWARLDPRLWDAAATLGASPLRRVREVTLPCSRRRSPARRPWSSSSRSRRSGSSSCSAVPARATLEAEIFYAAARAFDLRTAAALALVQLVAVAVLVLLAGALERRTATALPADVGADRRPQAPRRGARAAAPSSWEPPPCSSAPLSPRSSAVRCKHRTGSASPRTARSPRRRRPCSCHRGTRSDGRSPTPPPARSSPSVSGCGSRRLWHTAARRGSTFSRCCRSGPRR